MILPGFKLYIIKDYQRLKKDEANRLAIGWDAERELSKINYRIHTDAVKEFLITPTLSPQEMAYTYASEADILNMALFGNTSLEREMNYIKSALLYADKVTLISPLAYMFNRLTNKGNNLNERTVIKLIEQILPLAKLNLNYSRQYMRA